MGAVQCFMKGTLPVTRRRPEASCLRKTTLCQKQYNQNINISIPTSGTRHTTGQAFSTILKSGSPKFYMGLKLATLLHLQDILIVCLLIKYFPQPDNKLFCTKCSKRDFTDLASVTTCEKDENGSWSDGGSQLGQLRLSVVPQGLSHIFSWVITGLKQEEISQIVILASQKNVLYNSLQHRTS